MFLYISNIEKVFIQKGVFLTSRKKTKIISIKFVFTIKYLYIVNVNIKQEVKHLNY